MSEITFFRKRSGRIVNFKIQKIADAIAKALTEACSVTGRVLDIKETANALAGKVKASLDDTASRFYVKEDEVGSRVPRLEHVQDAVVDSISQSHGDIPGYDSGLAALVGRLYADYRKKREEARKLLKVRSEKDSADVTDKALLLDSKTGVLSGWDRTRIVKDLVAQHVDEDTSEEIAKEVERVFLKAGLTSVSSDLVAEFVNNELINRGLQVRLNTGKGYVVYKDFIDGLIKEKTVENSNIVNNNPEAVAFDIASNVFKQYALDNVFSPDIVRAHLTGSIHLHDLNFITRGYCGSHSIEYIKKYGLKNLVNLNTRSKPAKTASVLTGHLNTFLASMQAYYAGALGLGYTNVLYAPLLVGMSDKDLHQVAQELIFNGSQNAFSRGGQTLFLDFNIHTGVPSYLVNVPAIGPGGKYMAKYNINGPDWHDGEIVPLEETTDDGHWALRFQNPYREEDTGIAVKELDDGTQWMYDAPNFHVLRYGDYQDEARRFAMALLQVWEEGDADGHVFEFPKCDFHVSAETFTDAEQYKVYQKACEVASQNGSTYFVFDRDAVSLASCCFSGDTRVYVGEGKNPHLMTFEQAWEKYGKTNRTVKTYDRGTWRKAKVIRLSGKGRRMLDIAFGCGKHLTVTADHEFPTNNGVKKAYELTPEDAVELSAELVPGHKNCVNAEQARILGALAGAYMLTGRKEMGGFRVTTAKEIDGTPLGFDCFLLQHMAQAGYHGGIEVDGEDSDGHIELFISNPEIVNGVGKLTTVKEDGVYLSDAIYREDYEARFGVLVGLLAASAIPVEMSLEREKAIFEQIEAVATTVGTMTFSKPTENGEAVIDVAPVITGVSADKSVIKGDDKEFLKVLSVKESMPRDFVYCFSMLDTREPFFTLPSGIVTHNCRLKVQVTDMSLLRHPERLRTSFPRNEMVVIRRNNGPVEVTSMGRLFDEIPQDAIKEGPAEVKYLENTQIWDKEGWTALHRVLRHPKNVAAHSNMLTVIRTDFGQLLTLTDNHPVILSESNRLTSCPKCGSSDLAPFGTTAYGKQVYKCYDCSKYSVGPMCTVTDQTYEKEAADVKVNDTVTMANDVSVEKNKALRAEEAYLLGAYVGDGSMYTGHRVVCISKPANHPTIKKVKECVERLSGKSCAYSSGTARFPVSLCPETLRVGHSAYMKQLPPDYMSWTPETFGAVLSGLIDTDGSVHKGEILVSSTSKVLVSQIHMYLNSIGIPSAIRLASEKPTINNALNGKEGITATHLPYGVHFNNNLITKELLKESIKVAGSMVEAPATRKWNAYGRVTRVSHCTDEKETYVYDVTTGSHTFVADGVLYHNCGFQNVTINIPQCAYRAKHRWEKEENRTDERLTELFLEEIDSMMDLCKNAHIQKRAFIETLMQPGRPMWQMGMPANDGKPYLDLNTSVYIIGMLGVNDAIHYLTGKEMHESDEAMDYALKVISHMFLRTKQYTAELGWPFKLEESPAESAARRLAKADLVYYRDDALTVFKGTEDAAYYTNSIHLAAAAPVDLVERIRKQSMFHSAIESGAIIHAFIGEEHPSPGAIEELVRLTFLKTQCAQLVLSPEFTYCQDCGGKQRGLVDVCDQCGSHNVVGETRVVGYYSRVQNFNKSKRYGELVDRHRGRYKVEEAE